MEINSSRKAEISFDPDLKEFTYNNQQSSITWIAILSSKWSFNLFVPWSQLYSFSQRFFAKYIFHATNKKHWILRFLKVNVVLEVQITCIVWSSTITKEVFSHLALNCCTLIGEEIYLSTCTDSLCLVSCHFKWKAPSPWICILFITLKLQYLYSHILSGYKNWIDTW